MPIGKASDIIFEYENDKGRRLNAVASPLPIDGERPRLRRNPPELGQNSCSVLTEISYGEKVIEELVESGVIQTEPRSTGTV
jgi:crotonobetainyl-CoA:carnitine CoA-transferase CaiB-like acyl-CoA transferase